MFLRTLLLCCLPFAATAETMRMAVTTSFENSGLADVLLPALAEDTGIEVQLVIVGTGQALRLGEAGDVDAILVHARPAEEAFVAAGHAPYRREIMYNDFVIVGPVEDPAQLDAATSAPEAFARIATAEAPFVSRGDDSGTHQTELTIWATSGLAPDGPWYRPVGAGMGAALNTAVGMGAYVFSDRASWLNFGNKDGMEISFEGDPMLFNQYAYLPINPDKNDAIKAEAAKTVESWLTSDTARDLIDGYRIQGQQLFTFNATR